VCIRVRHEAMGKRGPRGPDGRGRTYGATGENLQILTERKRQGGPFRAAGGLEAHRSGNGCWPFGKNCLAVIGPGRMGRRPRFPGRSGIPNRQIRETLIANCYRWPIIICGWQGPNNACIMAGIIILKEAETHAENPHDYSDGCDVDTDCGGGPRGRHVRKRKSGHPGVDGHGRSFLYAHLGTLTCTSPTPTFVSPKNDLHETHSFRISIKSLTET